MRNYLFFNSEKNTTIMSELANGSKNNNKLSFWGLHDADGSFPRSLAVATALGDYYATWL